MIPAGRVGWPCILSSSKLSTDDDAIVFEGEYCSILKSGLTSPGREMGGIEGWSSNEMSDLRLSPLIVTTETVTPALLFTTDEVPCDDPRRVNDE